MAINGKIKTIVIEKGFGFILADDNKEYFFHHSALQDSELKELRKDDRVTFTPTTSTKGPRAEEVFLA